jgi:hypothetical protein
MKFKIFTIPAWRPLDGTDELNAFTSNHKVLEVIPRFCDGAGKPFWTFAVSYLDSSPDDKRYKKTTKKEKTDYKSILDEASFEQFKVLRKIRKTLSETFAVPAFAIMTDRQMAELAKHPEISVDTFSTLSGFGEGKTKRFAQAIIDALKLEKDSNIESNSGETSIGTV